MEDVVTTDMARFGWRELKLASELLNGLMALGTFPDGFDSEGVQIAMNTKSGFVFLTNAEYQVCMMNGDNLETWYSCPICGHEGFLEDMEHGEDSPECQEYLEQIRS